MDINVKIYGYHIDINLRKRNWLAKWYLKFFKVHAKEEFTGNHCFFYMFDHDWFPPLISRTQCFPAAPFRDTAKKTISKVWSEIVLLPTLGASNMQNQNHPGGNPGNHTSTCIYIYIYYIPVYIYRYPHIHVYSIHVYPCISTNRARWIHHIGDAEPLKQLNMETLAARSSQMFRL